MTPEEKLQKLQRLKQLRDLKQSQVMQNQQKPSLGKTVFDQGMQGSTFGFADEVTDRIGAGIASLATGEPYSDMLKMARETTQEELDRQQKERPFISMGSQIAGSIIPGVASGATRAGSGLANWVRGGGLGARAGKGALVGAGAGGLYGLGAGVDQEKAKSALGGAVLGGAVGAASPYVGAAISRAIKKKPEQITAQKLREMASKAYQKADKVGGELSPEFTDQFVNQAQKELIPDDPLVAAMKSMRPAQEAAEDIGLFAGQPMSLSRAQALDEQLGDMISSNYGLKGVNKTGKKLQDVQGILREMIANADDKFVTGGKEGFEALTEGRDLWSKAMKMADVERIIKRAEMTDNPATAIKTGFRTLANNPKKMRGYTEEERKLIEKAAKSGVIADALRTMGSRLMPIVTFGASGGSPAATLGTMAASDALRGAATRSQLSKAEKLARAISGQQINANPLLSQNATQKLLYTPAITGAQLGGY